MVLVLVWVMAVPYHTSGDLASSTVPFHFVPLFLSTSTQCSMASKSFHIKALACLLSTFHHATHLFIIDNLDQIIDSDLDDEVFDENNDLFLLVSYLHQRICQIHQSQYLPEQSCSKGSLNVYGEDLATDDDDDLWMHD